MPSDQKIDYIELPAEDFEAVEAFYSSAFSWSFTNFGPDYRAFSDEKLDGGFYSPTFGHEQRMVRRSSCYMLVVLRQPGIESLLLAAAFTKKYFPFREAADFIF